MARHLSSMEQIHTLRLITAVGVELNLTQIACSFSLQTLSSFTNLFVDGKDGSNGDKAVDV